MKSLLIICGVILPLVLAKGKKPDCLTVKGHVECKKNPSKAKNVMVELVDDNWIKDEVVDKGFTSSTGYFMLQGCAKDGKFTKQVRLFHDCDEGKYGSEWIHKLPKEFTSASYDMALIKLEDDTKFPASDRKKYKKTLPTPCQRTHRRHRRYRYRRMLRDDVSELLF